MKQFKLYIFDCLATNAFTLAYKFDYKLTPNSICFFRVANDIASEPYVVKLIYAMWLDLLINEPNDINIFGKYT